MENDWKEPYADDGVTLGPEEALRREIEKTKALKLERLQLKDSIEKLRAENASLAQTNQPLTKKMDAPAGETTGDSASPAGARLPSGKPMSARGWALSILAFNLAAAGAILFFILK